MASGTVAARLIEDAGLPAQNDNDDGGNNNDNEDSTVNIRNTTSSEHAVNDRFINAPGGSRDEDMLRLANCYVATDEA
ncbi:uncharacterized protein JN550_013809 [Neoarthrinium moseri]|uniref:uncharacterized protein n=1 Tax=Neoarthrinium moseri TaxID=1658444 RepID=UPI001FDC063D|nr:uncharacterized protein JN550_013809 [Neoarthrinium moseri]KAI1856478.1 hypothetical protein JN550_013809 [Neoarthrinium moseri]